MALPICRCWKARRNYNWKISKIETREYRTLDKTTWGDGPWQEEPDKRQWQDERTGLPCLIVRNNRAGNLCGYVGVPSAHPAHGKSYSYWSYDDDGNEAARSPVEAAINDVEVHGGLTFADSCSHSGDESRGICHVPGHLPRSRRGRAG